MSFKSWFSSLAQPRSHTVRYLARRRQQLIVEELESRVAPATFAEAGSILNLDLNVANKSVSIVSAGASYSMTLTGDTWSGTNSANVTGNGTSVLTVSAAGLAAFNTFNFTDSAAGAGVTFANSGSNAYSDNFNVTLDSSPATSAVQFTGTSSFTLSNSINVNTTQNIVFASGSTLTMSNGAVTLSANSLSISGTIQGNGAATFNVANVTSIAGTTIFTGTGLTVNNTGTASTLAGNITGPGGLIKNGVGTLVLTGVKTYGGATTISAGTLQLGDGVTDGSFISNSVVDNATLNFNNVNALTFGGAISGNGAVTKSGGGILTISGANTYGGTTTINSGSTIKLGNSGATSANSTISGAGTLDLNNFSTTIGGLQGATITNNAAGTGTAQVFAAITTTFNGVIKDGATAHVGVSVTSPSGITLTMAGTNSYTGPTILGSGVTLKAGSTNGTSPNSVIAYSGPGTFDLNGFNTAVAGLSGTVGTVTNNGATAAVLTVTGASGGSIGSKIVDGTSATGVSIGGTLVTMTPAGSTYSGATTINSGNTLKLLGSGATSGNSTISGAGTLDLNNSSITIAGLQGATITNNAAGTGTAAVSAGITTTFNGTIKDGATAHVGVSVTSPSGITLTTAGTNSYTGPTIVGAGVTLKVGSANGTSANSVIGYSGPGTFDLNGFNTAVAGLSGTIGTATNNGATAAVLTVTGASGGSIGSKIVDGTSATGVTIGGTLVTFTPAGSTYSGATTINAGNTLRLLGSGATSGNSTITGAGTLDLNNASTNIGGLQGATITNNAAGTGTAPVFAAITTTFNGVIKDGATAHVGVSVTGPSGITLTMAGTNSYSGPTVVGAGVTLKAGSTNGTSANSVIAYSGPGTFDLNGFNTAVAGLVATIGAATNNGATAAVLTVTGAGGASIAGKIVDGTSTTGVAVSGTLITMTPAGSTYSGATTINAGNTLKLVSSGATSANSTITGAGTLDLNNASTNIGGLQGATITNNAAGAGTATVFAAITTTFNGTIMDGPTAHTSVGINGPVGTTLTMAGTNSYTGATTIANATTLRAGSTNGTSANSVVIFISGAGTFDLNNFDTAVAGVFGNGNVTLGSGTLTVGNAASSNITAAISGSGGLTKVGAGTLILFGPDTYTGTTTISAGTLQITTPISLSTGPIVDNASLALSLFATVGNVISGTGGLTVLGGIITMTAANTYTGTTAVNSGTLLVNGSLADGPAAADVTVANGATLGGSGTVAGNILVQSGGIFSPGNSPGILNTGAVTFAVNSNFFVEVNGTSAGAQYDQLNSTGAVSLGNAHLNLTLGFTSPIGNVFTIVSAASVLGTFSGLVDGTSIIVNGRELRLNYTATSVTLTDITNTPPVIAADVASVSADEGGIATNSGTFFDAQGNATVTITASVGTVTQDNSNGTWNWSLAAADGPAGPFTVTITATDDRGAAAHATFTHTIDNVPPTISLSGNATVDEGSPYTLNLGVVTDPGQDTITSYKINWGDGVIDTFTGSPANTTATHTFADGPSSQLNNVTVTDEDGTFLAGSLSVQVLNVAPTATLVNGGAVDEGSAGTDSFSNQFDPSPADSDLHYAYDFDNDGTFDSGDGTYAGSTADGASVSVPASFFADGPGTRTVLGRIIDKDGGFSDYTTTITINNVAPTATLSNGGAVAEGSTGTVSFSNQFDPSTADSDFHYAYDFDNDGTFDSGDGTYAGSTADGASVTVPASFFADGPGTRTVLGRIIDKDGGFTDYTTTITINNVAPTVTLLGASSASEGQTLHFTFTIDDPGVNDTFNFVATSGGSVGTVSNQQIDDTTRSGSFDVTFSDGPALSTVSVQVADSDGADSNVSSIDVHVANVAPVFTNLQVDHATINMGETATLSGTFTDPGVLDTHTVVVNWGDGSANTSLNLSANMLTFSLAHQYVNTQPGNPAYTISVTVTDKDAGSATSTTSITVLSSVYVLNLNAAGALSVADNASIHVAGLVDVDSSSATALQASGNSAISAASIMVTGGVQQTGNATLSITVTGAPVAPDPLAFLTSPTLADLGLTSMPTPTSVTISGNTTLTIDPGVYSQIKVSGNAQLILNPGIYVIAGGGLTVTGNGGITSNGVMIYNAGSNYVSASGTPTFGGLTLSGNGAIQLTPIATGPFAGILIFQSRDNTRAMSLSGNSLAMQGGAIYAQQALLAVSGNADIKGSLVVNQLHLTSNAASALDVEGVGPTLADTAGQLLAGDLVVYVDNSAGQFTSDELARIADAIDAINIVINPYGVAISTVSETDRASATTVLQIGNTSAVGGAADGVLGCESAGNVTIVSGWDWYANADSGTVGADQYDFQTIVTHELGHALGLGHSTDSGSVMYATLNPGEAHRVLATADLAIPDVGEVACGLHASTRTPSEQQPVLPSLNPRLFTLPVVSTAMLATPSSSESVLQERSIWDSIAMPQPFAQSRGTYLPMENLNTTREEIPIQWLADTIYYDDANSATLDWARFETRDANEIPFNVFSAADTDTESLSHSLIEDGSTIAHATGYHSQENEDAAAE